MNAQGMDLSGMPTDTVERIVSVLAGIGARYALELGAATKGASGATLEAASRSATEAYKAELRKVMQALGGATGGAPVQSAEQAPWDDLKVGFAVADTDALWAASDSEQLSLPAGWKLWATNGSGARDVAIFRVDHAPTWVEGLAVQAAIRPFCITEGGV